MYLLSKKLSFIHSFFMLIFSITADFRFKLPVWISYKLILQVVVLVFERMDSNNNSPGHQRSEANREEVRRCLHKLLGWLQENREHLQNALTTSTSQGSWSRRMTSSTRSIVQRK